MIATQNYQSRRGARVRLVVLHTTEGARTVESLGRYFQTGTNQASYHAAFDDQRMETFVDYSNASWSIMSGNNYSDNAAFCAFSAWNRAEWLKHPVMLELGARWIAERCTARGIPIRRLSPAETAAACRDPRHPGGVIMHRDYTLGMREGTHTDCGDGLPWDMLLSRAQQIASPEQQEQTPEDDMPAGEWKTTTTPEAHVVCFPIGPKVSSLTAEGWIGIAATQPGQVQFDIYGMGHGLATEKRALRANGREWLQLPDGTENITITISTEQPAVAGWGLELRPMKGIAK